MWSKKFESPVTCIENIDLFSFSKELTAVATLEHGVAIMAEKHQVDFIATDRPVVAMKFGQYGREKNALALLFKGTNSNFLALVSEAFET